MTTLNTRTAVFGSIFLVFRNLLLLLDLNTSRIDILEQVLKVVRQISTSNYNYQTLSIPSPQYHHGNGHSGMAAHGSSPFWQRLGQIGSSLNIYYHWVCTLQWYLGRMVWLRSPPSLSLSLCLNRGQSMADFLCITQSNPCWVPSVLISYMLLIS